MGASSRQDQDPQLQESNVVSASDESFSVGEDGRPVPWGRGRFRVSGKYVMCGFYGTHYENDTNSGGKKGGKKGGGSKLYYGTIACQLCDGPLTAIDAIVLNGEQVWPNGSYAISAKGGTSYTSISQPSSPLFRSYDGSPDTIATRYGNIIVYWGTETQAASTVLNSYESHPAYHGIAYLVFNDFNFGQSPNAYNVVVIARKAPVQSIVTGSTAAESLDGGTTCNAVVAAAEILVSQAWAGIDPAKLSASTFQATADALQADVPAGNPANRSIGAVAPMWADSTETRAALADLMVSSDTWLRATPDGLIEAGRWRRDTDAITCTTLTFDDFTNVPESTLDDVEQQPTSFAVEFQDETAWLKDAKIAFDVLHLIVDRSVQRKQQTIKRPFLHSYAQAIRAGQDAARLSQLGAKWMGDVRFTKARNPDGSRIRPGDYLQVPINAIEDSTQTQLVRVTKTVWPKNSTDPVKIEGVFDVFGGAPTLTADLASDDLIVSGMMKPPIAMGRVFALPADVAGSVPPIYLLACKPSSLATGFQVSYSSASTGDFQSVGVQPSFALPLSLSTGANSTATTLTVATLTEGSGDNGSVYDRDGNFIRNYSGGDLEGRNDTLLLIAFKRCTGGATAYQSGGMLEYMEVMSVDAGATLVGTNTWTVPVLRGRMGTTALDWTDTSTTELWLIAGKALVAQSHADFASMLASGASGYFRLASYASSSIYDPAAARAEFLRLQAYLATFTDRSVIAASSLEIMKPHEFGLQTDSTTNIPVLSYVLPPGLYTVQVIGGATYS